MRVSEPTVQTLPLRKIRMDDRVNMRDECHWVTVQEYSEAYDAGDPFPPVVAFFDGVSYFLADGWHRVLAQKKLGRKEIQVEVRTGTRRDAMLYAAGANAKHGVRRTNKDKRRAVLALLGDKEWRQWNDSEIGRRCGVSGALVKIVRETAYGEAKDTDFRMKFDSRRGTFSYVRATTKKDATTDEPTTTESCCPTCGRPWPTN